MTSISFDLSGTFDPLLTNVLKLVKREADALDIDFFVVGATARDILLEHCHGIRAPRATRDIDIGIEVAGWDEFQRLSSALVATGKFSPAGEPYKFWSEVLELDIVPFGPIGGDALAIRWPPDQAVVMNVMGFQEAFELSIQVCLSKDPPLEVRLPTIAGMALMKLISWKDRYPERPKDAEDLLFLMEHYAEAGNDERLYGDCLELTKAEGFDLDMAGIRLLGQDMAILASPATAGAIRTILDEEADTGGRCRLVTDMARSTSRLRDRINELVGKLGKLREGFNERFSAYGT